MSRLPLPGAYVREPVSHALVADLHLPKPWTFWMDLLEQRRHRLPASTPGSKCALRRSAMNPKHRPRGEPQEGMQDAPMGNRHPRVLERGHRSGVCQGRPLAARKFDRHAGRPVDRLWARITRSTHYLPEWHRCGESLTLSNLKARRAREAMMRVLENTSYREAAARTSAAIDAAGEVVRATSLVESAVK